MGEAFSLNLCCCFGLMHVLQTGSAGGNIISAQNVPDVIFRP